jgi:aldehyde dehydrogenase (NAD+)
VEHAGVDKIAFTGSTEVGRLILGDGGDRQIPDAGTRRQVAVIVFDDADLDGAVEGVVDASGLIQGQVCCAGRGFWCRKVAAEFIKRLKRRMGKLGWAIRSTKPSTWAPSSIPSS